MRSTIAGDVLVIDTDSHVTEPPDLWSSRLSKRWGELIPSVEVDEKTGRECWKIGDDFTLPVAQLATAGWHEPFPAYPSTLEEADPAAFDPHERLKRLDEYGVWAQVLYPNLVAFVTTSFMALGRELSLECIRASNDFMTDFASVDRRRLVPIAMLPFWDVEASVQEMERCRAEGHKGILLAPNFDRIGLPNIADPMWAPILEAAQGLELSVNFHIGLSNTTKEQNASLGNLSHEQPRAVMAQFAASQFLSNATAIGYLTLSGICHRYPRLQFVSVESGFGYVPFLLQALDWEFENFFVRLDHPDWELPSEYFRRQIYATFWFEQVNAGDVESYQDNLMFETDFPHPVSLSPGPNTIAKAAHEVIDQNLDGLPEGVIRKVLHDNAARLYHLDP